MMRMIFLENRIVATVTTMPLTMIALLMASLISVTLMEIMASSPMIRKIPKRRKTISNQKSKS